MSLISLKGKEAKEKLLEGVNLYVTFLEQKEEWTVSDCIFLVKLQDLTKDLDSERTGSGPHPPNSLVWRLQALGSRLPTSWTSEVTV